MTTWVLTSRHTGERIEMICYGSGTVDGKCLTAVPHDRSDRHQSPPCELEVLFDIDRISAEVIVRCDALLAGAK